MAAFVVAGFVATGDWLWHAKAFQYHLSSFRYQVTLAERDAKNIVGIALGDSHAGLGFRSTDSGVVSLAFAGENVREIATKVEYLLPLLPNLKVVYLQAQPHMFYVHRDGPIRKPFHELGGGLSFHPLEWLSRQFDPCCRALVPRAMLRLLMGRGLPKPVPAIQQNGYLLYPLPKRESRDLMAEARREVGSYQSIHAVRGLRRAYTALVANLAERKIDLLLTRYPLSPEYRGVLPAAAFADGEAYFTSLVARYDVRQCGSWSAIEDPALFYNSDHLNAQGAAGYWTVLKACRRGN